jgi:hypothetical protein
MLLVLTVITPAVSEMKVSVEMEYVIGVVQAVGLTNHPRVAIVLLVPSLMS